MEVELKNGKVKITQGEPESRKKDIEILLEGFTGEIEKFGKSKSNISQLLRSITNYGNKH